MSEIKCTICDRCGERLTTRVGLYKYKIEKVINNPQNHLKEMRTVKFDLCDACQDSLHFWLND